MPYMIVIWGLRVALSHDGNSKQLSVLNLCTEYVVDV